MAFKVLEVRNILNVALQWCVINNFKEKQSLMTESSTSRSNKKKFPINAVIWLTQCHHVLSTSF